MEKEKTLIEKIEEAFICRDCNGFGEVKYHIQTQMETHL